MRDLSLKLELIEQLRKAIELKGNLPQDALRKVEQKFRLECNFNSNQVEGGTLTRQKTRSVMIGNITVEGRPPKDIREMKGHDGMMLELIRLGQGEVRLSESRIRAY